MPTKQFQSIQELADHLRMIKRDRIPLMKDIILESAGEIIANEAKNEIIGRITPLPGYEQFPRWEPLAQSTLDQKARYGLGKGSDPRSMLYATGEMMESIEFRIVRHKAVAIGSDDPVLSYHEYGTTHMPPRPVLGPAVIRSMPRIIPRAEKLVYRTLCGEMPRWI